MVQPAVSQATALLAGAPGFELRLVAEETAGGGPATYELAVASAADDELTIRVLVSAGELKSTELLLDYDQRGYRPVEGQYGDWPGAAGKVSQVADLSVPGQLRYLARLSGAEAPESVSGSFELLRLTLARLEAPTSANEWPRDEAARQWLSNWYTPLPALTAPGGVYGSAQTMAYADEVFRLLNAERTDKNHTPLRRDPHLDAVAQAHARQMAEAGFFDHANPQGLQVFERIDAIDAPRWYTAGENIAAGYQTPQAAHQGWMDSRGHKKNIRNEQYRHVGIGAYHAPETELGWYWVQVFASFDTDPAQHDWIEPGEQH